MTARLAFAGGDFAFNLFWQGSALFLMYFYTDVLGLSPALAGLIYLIAMVWDAVTDPIMGMIADRTRTRWGRFRPYILFGALPLAISYPLAFSAPDLSETGLFWWALATHVWLRTCYTIVGVPFSSLQARITQDSDERTAFAGARMIGGALGGLTIAFATPTIVQAFGGDERVGYFMAGCIAGVLALAFFLFCFFAMREPADDAPPAPWEGFLREALAFVDILKTNKPLRQVFFMIVIASVAVAMFGKCMIYYFKYDLRQPENLTLALVLPAFMALLAAPVWVWVAKRTSKRTTFLLGAALAGCAYVAFFFNPLPSLISVLILIGVAGCGGIALGVAFWSMLPDTVEYGEAHTGVRHEARIVGFSTLAQKAALGVNALLLGATLELSGFVANAEQSEATLAAIRATMTLIPATGLALIAYVLWSYPINAAYHTQLKNMIAMRKAV
jgi:GPH family glycoside/pentoside/hexuronide:cation symporter